MQSCPLKALLAVALPLGGSFVQSNMMESGLRQIKHAPWRSDLVVFAKVHVAMVQNQWYHFGTGAPLILEPILVGIAIFTGGTGF